MYTYSNQEDREYLHRVRVMLVPLWLQELLDIHPYTGQTQNISRLLDPEELKRNVPAHDLKVLDVWQTVHSQLARGGNKNQFFTRNSDYSFRGAGLGGHYERSTTTAFTDDLNLQIPGEDFFNNPFMSKDFLDIDFFQLNNLLEMEPEFKEETTKILSDFSAFRNFAVSQNVGFGHPDSSEKSMGLGYDVEPIGVIDDTHVIGLFPYLMVNPEYYEDGVTVEESRHSLGIFYRNLYRCLRNLSIPSWMIYSRGVMDGYLLHPRLNGMASSQIW